jgi:hypothetical protein
MSLNSDRVMKKNTINNAAIAEMLAFYRAAAQRCEQHIGEGGATPARPIRCRKRRPVIRPARCRS